jgi:hypothetical protein
MGVCEEVLDQPVDRNIVNIKLVPLDEKEQQVERPLELGQLYLVGRGQRARLYTKLEGDGRYLLDEVGCFAFLRPAGSENICVMVLSAGQDKRQCRIIKTLLRTVKRTRIFRII